MTDLKTRVDETVSRIADTANQDHAIKDNAHARRQTTLPPHLQGLGIDTSAAQKARDRMAQTDANLSSIPKFEPRGLASDLLRDRCRSSQSKTHHLIRPKVRMTSRARVTSLPPRLSAQLRDCRSPF